MKAENEANLWVAEEKGGCMRFHSGFWLHPQAVYMKLFRPTDGNFYTFFFPWTLWFSSYGPPIPDKYS